MIQNFTGQEAQVKQQVEASQAKIEAFEAALPRYE
jgi:hypothetical protein